MNLRRRIVRESGHAASQAAPGRTRERPTVELPGDRALFDDFLSESTDDADTIDTPASPKPRRLSHGFKVLSDADAFLSEVAACESDRPASRDDIDAFPLDGGFLSEDKGLPALDAASEIDDVETPPEWWIGRRALPRAASLIALSAGFFVAVVLFTEALDRVNQVLFTTDGPSVAERRVEAGAPSDVVADLSPLVARPLTRLARFATPTPIVVAHRGADGQPIPADSIATSPLVHPEPPIAQPDDRLSEPPAQGSEAASRVEAPMLALEPVHVALVPPPPPPLVVARAVSDSAGPAPAPLAAPNETDKIGGVLTRYRGAFNALDSSAARGVWPTVDERALDRAFARLEQQEVAFDRCDIDVAGVHAAARCTGSARYVPKVGSRTPQTTTREWRFNLQKVDDRWVIEDVDAR